MREFLCSCLLLFSGAMATLVLAQTPIDLPVVKPHLSRRP